MLYKKMKLCITVSWMTMFFSSIDIPSILYTSVKNFLPVLHANETSRLLSYRNPSRLIEFFFFLRSDIQEFVSASYGGV